MDHLGSIGPVNLHQQTKPALPVQVSEISNLFNKTKQQFEKLEQPPHIHHEISHLTNEVKKLTDSRKPIERRIERLEGEKYSKLLIIGSLIKLLFQWINAKELSLLQRSTIPLLEKQQLQYEHKVATLRQSLPQLEAKAIEALPSIFEIEYQLREILESRDFPEKNKYQELYTQIVLPMTRMAKEFLKTQPIQFSVQAAAAKGKAAQAGFKAIKALSKSAPILTSSGVSAQEVYLLPKLLAVFKRGHARASEEESIVNDLFNLMSQQAVVGSYNIGKASREIFGVPTSKKTLERGYTPEQLSPKLQAAIGNNLSFNDRNIVEKVEKNPTPVDEATLNYKTMEKAGWFLEMPGHNKKRVSFQELQNLYLKEQLPPDARIESMTENISLTHFAELIKTDSPLVQALNYIPSLHSPSPMLYYTPDLVDPDNRKAYEKCERFKWQYLDEQGQRHEVSFKDLHALYIQKTPLFEIMPIVTSSSTSTPTDSERGRALSASWKVITPELMRYEGLSELKTLANIQAKPFIAEMILMKDMTIPIAKEALLQRLTSDAEFNAILTGELQLLDLHSGNLGVEPVQNPEYEEYKDLKFYIGRTEYSMKQLMIEYLAGKILPSTLIEFEKDGQKVQKQLKDLPDLQKALDVQWKFVIFDTDLSLAENNELQFLTTYGKKEHLVPLRSTLLESSWKDRPLSETTIERLLGSEERDLRVDQWMKREDAPIYRFLPKELKEKVHQFLDPVLKRYTLSEARQADSMATIKSLTRQFAKDLSAITEENVILWQSLEQELSMVKIKPGDTLEKIAARHHQKMDELMKLNPSLKLIPGKKIKIKLDLTSTTPEAVASRNKIATQFFPRMTMRQQEAMRERQMRRKSYLEGYKDLMHLPESHAFNDKVDKMTLFIQTSPLTSSRRQALLTELSSLTKSDPNKLETFRQNLCKECQPTYFNLMKAMYPLLADGYALAAVVKGPHQAGTYVGLFSTPLEDLISDVKANYPSASEEYALALSLETHIRQAKNASFFI